jgi:hypothetical protein
MNHASHAIREFLSAVDQQFAAKHCAFSGHFLPGGPQYEADATGASPGAICPVPIKVSRRRGA